MATFETQVEALTGISIAGSSSQTLTELSSFLADGVKDVVNRMIEARPAELSKFTNTTNSTSYVDKIGKILSVAREHDSTTILRKCTSIDPGERYDATDSDSLNYRSKTNPGFYELDGAIYTVPAAGSGNNDIIVTQVHYDTGLLYVDTYGASNSSIVSFPSDNEHLVALYAAIKSLGAKMGAIRNSLSSFSITAVPPDMPTTGTSIPTYNEAEQGVTIDDEITQMLTYIETDEDVELAGAQLQKIGSYIGAYNAAMTNQLHEFNEANAKYQAEIKEHLQVSANEVTRLTTIYNKASDINLQNAIRTYQTQVDEYTQKITRYSSEVASYNADVSREVQEYTNNFQSQGTNYQWRQGQMLKLQAQYDRAFIPPGAGGGE